MQLHHLNAIRISLQALAQPAAFQRSLLSVWREDVSELAERFVQAERHLTRGENYQFTSEQQVSLAALHTMFESFCGPTNAHHWCDDALDWSPYWSTIRELAVRCLCTFNWSNEQPPIEIGSYGEDYRD